MAVVRSKEIFVISLRFEYMKYEDLAEEIFSGDSKLYGDVENKSDVTRFYDSFRNEIEKSHKNSMILLNTASKIKKSKFFKYSHTAQGIWLFCYGMSRKNSISLYNELKLVIPFKYLEFWVERGGEYFNISLEVEKGEPNQ